MIPIFLLVEGGIGMLRDIFSISCLVRRSHRGHQELDNAEYYEEFNPAEAILDTIAFVWFICGKENLIFEAHF